MDKGCPVLSLASPLPIALYAWLALRRRVIDRIAGIVALVVGLIFFSLLWGGGAISLESRHYQPVSMLFLLVVGYRLTSPSRLFAWGSRVVLGGILLFGYATLLQRHINMASPNSPLAYANAENIMCDMPQSVPKGLQRLAEERDSIILTTDPIDICILNSSRHPTTRFILIDRGREFTNLIERHGRVSRLAFAMRTEGVDLDRAPIVRASFKDYAPEEWVSYELDGWQIWQAGDVIPIGEVETERS